MKVIFNADDFGFSKGVNLGIVEAYQNGTVRSTTMMAGMPGFEHAVLLAKANQGLKIGVHLTLSTGKSVGGVYKTLTDSDGGFLRLAELESKAASGDINLAEVEAEYEAQIQKILAAGITPDHFDSHHHTHNLPGIATVFLKLARKYGVMIRAFDEGLPAEDCTGIDTTDSLSTEFYNEGATIDGLQRIITDSGADTLEIMCHPAYIDHDLYFSSSYNVKRIYELQVLTSPELQDFIAHNGIELCSFSDLRGRLD